MTEFDCERWLRAAWLHGASFAYALMPDWASISSLYSVILQEQVTPTRSPAKVRLLRYSRSDSLDRETV